MFHSARWDYDYTGGDANGGLHKLADKRVALVGTGATGVQLVPHLGRDAQHLYVFQRTPSSVDVRANEPTDPQWAASLQPGWQEERKRNFHRWSPLATAWCSTSRIMVCDFWTELGRNLTARVAAQRIPHRWASSRSWRSAKRNNSRSWSGCGAASKSIVDDPQTAEALKPYYRVHVQAAVQQ